MGFTLKKLLSVFLHPVATGLVLLVIAALRRKHRDAWAIGIFAVALIVGSSLPLVQQLLAEPLERGLNPHQRVNGGPEPAVIVVLAGAFHASSDRQIWDQMNASTLRRTLEGIRLARMYPHALLYMSGGDPEQGRPAAPAMAALAIEMGISTQRLRVERHSRDTADQATALGPALGTTPFLLVTSATHMPRALTLFRANGTRPIPAPTDYLASANYRFTVSALEPSGDALAATEAAIHEYVGQVWSLLPE